VNPRQLIAVLLVAACVLRAATFTENFSTDPSARWKTFGDTSLFRWNSTNQNLEVIWDSSRSNSYFYLPLGTVLARQDDFTLGFDLRMSDITIGTSSNKPYTFQIAIGFLNFTNAIATNFFRGAGQSSFGPKNLVTFDYFPDSGFGATFAPTIVTTNNRILFSDNHPLEMTTGDWFHIAMSFTASNLTLKTTITKNGAAFSTIKDLSIAGSVYDFRCDTLAIMSYSDAVQFGSPQYWGSILAHGTVDNITATVPDPPVMNFSGVRSNTTWRAQFLSRTNWSYVLERTGDFVSWTNASATNSGTAGAITLQDTNAISPRSFYRIKALRP
jgi:hypothetical protein